MHLGARASLVDWEAMSWRRDTMITPPIEALLARVDSKFTLVTLAARRAREVNSYYNQLGQGPGSIVPPQVASTARKALSISFEEIAADKITYVRTTDDNGVPLEALNDEGEGGEGGEPGDDQA